MSDDTTVKPDETTAAPVEPTPEPAPAEPTPEVPPAAEEPKA